MDLVIYDAYCTIWVLMRLSCGCERGDDPGSARFDWCPRSRRVCGGRRRACFGGVEGEIARSGDAVPRTRESGARSLPISQSRLQLPVAIGKDRGTTPQSAAWAEEIRADRALFSRRRFERCERTAYLCALPKARMVRQSRSSDGRSPIGIRLRRWPEKKGLPLPLREGVGGRGRCAFSAQSAARTPSPRPPPARGGGEFPLNPPLA